LSAFWLEQLVLVEEFLREDKLEHGTLEKQFKEGCIKSTGKFSFAFWSGS